MRFDGAQAPTRFHLPVPDRSPGVAADKDMVFRSKGQGPNASFLFGEVLFPETVTCVRVPQPQCVIGIRSRRCDPPAISTERNGPDAIRMALECTQALARIDVP